MPSCEEAMKIGFVDRLGPGAMVTTEKGSETEKEVESRFTG
jgi:hypothetical protein